jgi:hypothetical protein
MKYKIGDIVEVSLSPKKGYSQKIPPVNAIITDIDDTKIKFRKTAYNIMLIDTKEETRIWIELEDYKVKILTA